MTKFILKIDHREHDLLKLFAENTDKVISVEISALEIGDIQMCSCIEDDEENENHKIDLIFERKTIADLDASIKDGRYHEQKSRMVSNVDRHRICYIIEGKLDKRFNENAIYGSLINTMFRDRIFEYRSENLKDTYEFIKRVWKKFSTDEEWRNGLTEMNVMHAVNVDASVYKHSTKSKNVDKRVVFINMLSNIQGCSTKIAEKIVNSFENMSELIDALNEYGGILKDIKVGTRKIGPVLAKRIHDQLVGE